jgi:hypothetical protein
LAISKSTNTDLDQPGSSSLRRFIRINQVDWQAHASKGARQGISNLPAIIDDSSYVRRADAMGYFSRISIPRRRDSGGKLERHRYATLLHQDASCCNYNPHVTARWNATLG